MIALTLQDALTARFKELFSDYALPTKGGVFQNVRVFAQYLPQPKGPTVKPRGQVEGEDQGVYGPEDFEANFPCVVVK
ncbi:MAG: hypothetical protein LBT65_02375, partial [Synergistaceae bacterium]|nr:hypothetical protein [Synergistaceae bacterium]